MKHEMTRAIGAKNDESRSRTRKSKCKPPYLKLFSDANWSQVHRISR